MSESMSRSQFEHSSKSIMENNLEKPGRPKFERFLIEKIENLPIRDLDKVDLILLLAGRKKAVDINVPREGNEWQDNLHELGLYFVEAEDLRNDKKRKFYVAKSQDDAEKLSKAFKEHDDIEAGILSGYPLSAVENYSNTTKELHRPDMKESEVIDLLRSRYVEYVDLPPESKVEELRPFIHFGLSAKNWEEELGVVREWAETIKNQDPELYSRLFKK